MPRLILARNRLAVVAHVLQHDDFWHYVYKLNFL